MSVSPAPQRSDLERVAPQARQSIAVMSDDEIRRSFRIAQSFAVMGELKGAPSPEVAFAKIAVGHDLGLSPARAIMCIDFVEGGIMIRGVQLLAWLRQHPTYDYRLPVEPTRESATIQLLGSPTDEQFEDAVLFRGRWWEVLGTETFTEQDAIDAGKLPNQSPKAAWNAYRKNMLIWRATSNAVKFYAGDVFNGVPIYTEADFDVDGTAEDVGGDLPQGLDLGPQVEAVLERAAALGHVGIADRATAEMTLGRQDPGFVAQWCVNATKVLDDMEASKKAAEAEPVDDVGVEEPAQERDEEAVDEAVAEVRRELAQREAMEEEAAALREQAENEAAEGTPEEAQALRDRAQTIEDEIAGRWPVDGQGSLGAL